MADPRARRGMALHTKILIGLLIGTVAGVASNLYGRESPTLLWVADNVAQPIGQIFLRLLFMVVVPLVFASVTMGVASLGDLRRIGRIGVKTLLIFLATTAIAVCLGLLLVNVIRPGESLDPAIRTALMAEYSSQAGEKVVLSQENRFGINTLVNIVPRNPIAAAASGDMLGLIFFSLMFGIALTLIPRDTSAPVMRVLEGVNQAVMVLIGFAMRLAPLGVAGLIFSVTAKFGFEVLQSLALYVVTVLAALTIHQFGVIGLIARVVVGIDLRSFYSRCRALMVTAFSTSSSSATLPTTIRTAEENFGVPREVAGFVLPLGATMNMNGTAMFEGVTVLFLAQVFGVNLDLMTQAIVVIMSVVTAIGVAGVPSGSIPLLVMVLGMVGVPGEGIALILGVDRILDMARTVPNVTGDLLTSLIVARSEHLPIMTEERESSVA
ncbi:MAG TPA: dicarboxylate/amino acid:cation symporter [Gemmatimonadales bacterium]|nr:dicarboxylate/amino acid:cation symporter [Gemmatimonadales bacterium]